MNDHPVTKHDLAGRTLGEFVLRERLDEGSFGAVYLCDQPGLNRSAVVKVLHHRVAKRGTSSARFVREAQLASRVDHPYAAHVYAFGVEPQDGLLWIAMELVQGVTLAKWLARRGPMSLDQFVPFFELVAEVVHAAHAKGIVHRDLKPDNIMIVERNGKLFPKLLDFGIAKLLDEVAPSGFADGTQLRLRSQELTSPSTALGTPFYMAPELWLSPVSAGASADVYALGVVAYEALTGRRPFRSDNIPELSDQHCGADVPHVAPGLPSSLDAVFERALAKRPEHRYRTAVDLAAALRTEADARLVSQIRTSARQWAASGRTSGLLWRDEMASAMERWTRRTSRADAALTATDVAFIEASREAVQEAEEQRVQRVTRGRRAVIAASLAMAAVVVGVALFRAAMLTRLAQQQAHAAQRLIDVTAVASEVEQGRAALLHDEYGDAQVHLGEAWRRGDHSPATAFMYARALQPLRSELARLPAAQGRMWSASWSPDGRQIVTTDDRSAQIWDAETHQLLFPMPHDDTVYDAKYTADGRRVVTACGDGAVRIWSTETGALVRELRLPGRRPRFYLLAVSGDNVAAVDFTGALSIVWNATTGAALLEVPLDGLERASIAFSPPGDWLATGGGDDVRVFDAATWRQVATLRGAGIRSVAWDPTGRRLATGSVTGDASIWDIPNGTRSRHLREAGESVSAVTFSPDGKLVAVAGKDGAEQVFDETGLVSRGDHLHSTLLSIEFDALSRVVVTAGVNGTVAISEALTGLPLTMLDGPQGVIRTARFDPSNRRVVGASWDGTVRLWDASPPYRRWNTPEIADGCGLVGGVVPDGRVLAVACVGHPTRIWDTADDTLLAELPPVAELGGDFLPVFPVATETEAALARGNSVELYALPGGRLIRTVVHRAAVTAVWLGSGGTLISGAADGSVLLTRDGEDPLDLMPSPASIDAVAPLSDGHVAAADARGHVRILDRAGTIADLTIPTRARMLRPSPDGRLVIAVPSYRGAAAPPILLDPDRHAVVARLDSPQAFSVRWIEGGRAILSTHADGTVRLWDVDGTPRRTFRGGTQYLVDATEMSGSMVVGGGGDGMLRFWDIQSGRQLWATPAHRSNLLGVYVDRKDIVTRGSSGELARWHLPDAESVITAGSPARGRGSIGL